MTAVTDRRVPGRAAQAVAALEHEVTFHDLYDAIGAPVYHDLFGTDTGEIRELVGVVRRIPGPVLELAAGTGRLTLPLLALGRDVTALELSGHMLGLLRRRLAAAQPRLNRRCQVVQDDMTTFALDRAFPVIVLGTTSISLLDQAGRARLYRTVRAHLAPGGRFLLSNVDLPCGGPGEMDDAGRPADQVRDSEVTMAGTSGRLYRIFEYWRAGSLTREITIVPHAGGNEPVTVCTSSVGVLPAGLIERELPAAGLVIRSRKTVPANGLPHRDVLMELEAL